MASSRFKGRLDKKRERYNKFGMYAAVTSTLEKSGGMTKISIGKQKVEQPNYHYDMAVGIRATLNGSCTPKQSLMMSNSQEHEGGIRSLRKTVTLDLQSVEDDITASIGSAEEMDKLNSSAQTTTDFMEIVEDDEGNQRISTRHPTVIQIVDKGGKLHKASKGVNQVENLILGNKDKKHVSQPVSPRTGRGVKVDYEEAVIEELMLNAESGIIDERPGMAKLTKVLEQSLRMNKLSHDKRWAEMTPFEHAKIKHCFTELLKDLKKQELRVQRARSILDSGKEQKGGASIDLLNNCMQA